MPRSGTTLIEQMISAHPQAQGAGEVKIAEAVLNGIRAGDTAFTTMPASRHGPSRGTTELSLGDRGRRYVEDLERLAGPEALRITDKLPGNYMWMGLLSAMLPGSRFIHCRRHPAASCLSHYNLHFGTGLPYSYNLRDLGRAYRCHDELMRHWANVVPSACVLHLRYEDVVRDVNAAQRRIMAFLDLPWEGENLDHRGVDRQVQTASAAQVRRPVYSHAIDRWKRDEAYIAPLLDELGDLAAEYERG